MIRHLIFDMDGTLADTAKATIPVCAEVSRHYGLPELSAEAIRSAIGVANPKFHCGQSEKVQMVAEIIGTSNKRQWAMVGDRPKDLSAARGNGIFAIAAGFGYCAQTDWPLFDAVLMTPEALLDWIWAQEDVP